MIKTFTTLAAAALFALVPISSASAQTKDINPWQDCGLGAMVFPENGTAAAISNLIWDLGTTAISSQISSPESCEGERLAAAVFIQQTYASLEVETAKGEGEILATAAEMMGCSADTHPAVIQQTRADLASRAAQDGFANMSKSRKAELYFLSMDKASAQCAV